MNTIAKEDKARTILDESGIQFYVPFVMKNSVSYVPITKVQARSLIKEYDVGGELTLNFYPVEKKAYFSRAS